MKNALFYYYRISIMKIVKRRQYYYFEDEYYSYYLWRLDKPISYLKEVILLRKNLINSVFMEIIYNIKNEALSVIDGYSYLLLREQKNREVSFSEFYNPYYCSLEVLKLRLLNHSDWAGLWSSKIDYFEYQKDYIKNKYKILYKSLDYFIGLSENAISYFNASNNYLKKDPSDILVVARRRVDLVSYHFYNPLNLVIDHKSRDVAEYFKYLFVNNIYDYDNIKEIIEKLNYSTYQYSLLMSRLLFPSFYFDVYESIINDVKREMEIVDIIKRTAEYEEYLYNIYRFINEKKSILKIDWLDKFS